jgi:gliding motility-associated-like protein
LTVATINSSTGVITGTGQGFAIISYTVTDVNNCSTTKTTDITVNPTPIISSFNDAICSGEPYARIPNGTIPSGTTYNWGMPTTNAGNNGDLTGMAPAATSTQININAQLTNNTNAAISATYSITATKGSCSSVPFNLVLSVTPKPYIANRIKQACSGASFTDQPSNSNGDIVPAGITYSWSQPSVPSGITNHAASGTPTPSVFSGLLNNSTSGALSVTYLVSTYNDGCTGTTFTETVVVNPTPVIASKSTTICSGSQFAISLPAGSDIVPASTTYSWNAPSISNINGLNAGTNLSSITGTLSNTTNGTITVTYTVVPSSSYGSGTCGGSNFSAIVVVKPLPSIASIGQPTQTGSGSTFNFSLGTSNNDIVPVGTTYSWASPSVQQGITGSAASGTPSPTTLTGTLSNLTGAFLDATYTIFPTANSCTGNSFTFVVRVYPKPIIGLKRFTFCSGGAVSNFVPNDGIDGDVVPTGTTYSWSAPVISGISGTISGTALNSFSSGTISNTTNLPIDIDFSVTPRANPQDGDAFIIRITVNPLPTAAIVVTENSGLASNDNTICSNELATITASPVVGNLADYEYTWSVPSGVITPTLNQYTYSSNKVGVYGLSIKNKNTNCVSATQTSTSLIVSTIPVAGNITGPNSVCKDASITLTANASQGTGTYRYYYWYDNSELVAPPFSSSSVIVTGRSPGNSVLTYKVQDGLNCYSEMSNGFNFQVNPLPELPTIVNINQPYDGNEHIGTAIPINPTTEEVKWYVDFAGTATSNAPRATNYTQSPVLSYALSRNKTTFCVSPMSQVSVNISKKELILTANNGQEEYNGSAYTSGYGISPNAGGFVNGESIASALSGTLSYTFSPSNPVNAGSYTITPSGLTANNDNYNITFAEGTLTINRKRVSIIGAAVQDKVYNGSDNADMIAGTLSGVISADQNFVTLTRTAKFPNKNVGDDLPITSTSTISGSAASNYTLDPTINVTASITRKQIEAIGVVTADKVYDGTTTASVTGGGFNAAIDPGTGSYSDKTPYKNDVIQLVPSGNFINKNVANSITITSTSTITGDDAGNYTLIQPTLTTRNITPKALTMSGLYIAAPKVYNGNAIAIVQGSPTLVTAQAPGAGSVTDGIPYSNDVVSISGTPIGTYNSKDVLTANAVSFSGLSLSGANANNYTLNIQSPFASSIVKKVLSMFGLSVPSTKVYDGSTSATVGGIPKLYNAVSSSSATDTDGFPIIGDEVSITGSPVGTYNSKDVISANYVSYSGLTLSGNQASNYTLNPQANSAARIVPLDILVKAEAQTKIYGEEDPYFTYVNDPLVGADTFMGSLERVAGENIGDYQINQGSLLLDPNYTIVYTPNTLKILQAELVIQPKPVERTYGDDPLQTVYSSTDFTTTGLKNSETIKSVTISLPSGIGSGNSKKDNAITYAGVVNASNPVAGNIDLNNYKISFLPGDLIVKKYGITIYAEPKEKRKTQLDPPFTYTVSRPLVEGDSLVGSLTREPGEEVGFYSILQGTVYVNDNYAIKYIASDLEILTIERVIVVPNAFTPNNDGLNDVLKIIHNSTITSINYYKIFDRSGKQIFETRNIKEGWDGKLNGAVAESDAYYWMVEYNTWDNKVFQVKGSFVLIK